MRSVERERGTETSAGRTGLRGQPRDRLRHSCVRLPEGTPPPQQSPPFPPLGGQCPALLTFQALWGVPAGS